MKTSKNTLLDDTVLYNANQVGTGHGIPSRTPTPANDRSHALCYSTAGAPLAVFVSEMGVPRAKLTLKRLLENPTELFLLLKKT
jgi:hypothetical protein